TAARYVAEGYLWNSGNFLFAAEQLLAELDRHEPAMVPAVAAAVSEAVQDLGFIRLAPAAFARAPEKTIDYALMGTTSRAPAVKGRVPWTGIGGWEAVYAVSKQDRGGNALHGPTVARDARNCLVHADGRLTAILGVDDVVVVTTPDAVLVVPRARAEEVRELVAELKALQAPEA